MLGGVEGGGVLLGARCLRPRAFRTNLPLALSDLPPSCLFMGRVSCLTCVLGGGPIFLGTVGKKKRKNGNHSNVRFFGGSNARCKLYEICLLGNGSLSRLTLYAPLCFFTMFCFSLLLSLDGNLHKHDPQYQIPMSIGDSLRRRDVVRNSEIPCFLSKLQEGGRFTCLLLEMVLVFSFLFSILLKLLLEK